MQSHVALKEAKTHNKAVMFYEIIKGKNILALEMLERALLLP